MSKLEGGGEKRWERRIRGLVPWYSHGSVENHETLPGLGTRQRSLLLDVVYERHSKGEGRGEKLVARQAEEKRVTSGEGRSSSKDRISSALPLGDHVRRRDLVTCQMGSDGWAKVPSGRGSHALPELTCGGVSRRPV